MVKKSDGYTKSNTSDLISVTEKTRESMKDAVKLGKKYSDGNET